MLQPFELFRPMYLPKLVSLGKMFLVTQTYTRAMDQFSEEKKINILVSDYDDLGLARVHLNAVKHDKFAAILSLDKPAHKNKLIELMHANSKYHVFWAIVKSGKELEERVNTKYRDHMRKYIMLHTNWRLDRNTSMRPTIQVTFGELYIILKHGSETLRIKFEDIERV